MRMNDVLVHELVHCYQEPEIWQRWAHEGHARFVEIFLAARPHDKYSLDNQAEGRFGRDFDGCMSDLRVGERTIDAYPCGGVAYWLRWLQTGRVNMLAKADAESPAVYPAPPCARHLGGCQHVKAGLVAPNLRANVSPT